jgi:hypothetical protein
MLDVGGAGLPLRSLVANKPSVPAMSGLLLRSAESQIVPMPYVSMTDPATEPLHRYVGV